MEAVLDQHAASIGGKKAMRPALPLRLVWRMLALAAAIVCVALMPNRAVAGCGDYVLVGAKADHTGLVSFAAGDGWAVARSFDPMPLPCKGPHCTRGNQGGIPPVSPVPTVRAAQDNWGIVPVELVFAVIPSTRFIREEFELRPAFLEVGVFRPPRLY